MVYTKLGLEIFINKFEIVVFTHKYKIPNFGLNVNNQELARTFSFKYLG